MAKGDDILERLITFAVAVIDFCKSLPRTGAEGHLVDQLIRSASAGAANYAEACSAESLRDFVHKLGICRKELNETHVWIRIFRQSGIGERERSDVLVKESDELCRIISASKKTADERLKRNQLSRRDF